MEAPRPSSVKHSRTVNTSIDKHPPAPRAITPRRTRQAPLLPSAPEQVQASCNQQTAAQSDRRQLKKQHAEWISKARTLQARVTAIEKDHSSVDRIESFIDEQLDYKDERAAEGLQMLEQLQHIRSLVNKLRQCITEPAMGQDYIDRLQRCMDTTETEVVSFKTRQRDRLLALESEEHTLIREVAAFERRIVEWENGKDVVQAFSTTCKEGAGNNGSRSARTSGLLARLKSMSSLPPAVDEFQDFMTANGGETGGWDPRDHHTFLRLKALYQREEEQEQELIGRVVAETAGQNSDSVRAHVIWYSEYLRLLDLKRSAIGEWRASKAAEKAEAKALKRQQGAEGGGGEDDKDEEQEEASPRTKRSASGMDEERLDKQRRLQEWKERKLQERQEAASLASRKASEEQRVRDQAAEAERAAVRDKLRQYKTERQDLEMVRRRKTEGTEQPPPRRSVSSADLDKLRQRDLEKVRVAQEKKAAEVRAMAEREEAITRLRLKVAPAIQRDPHRLLQPTQSAQKRFSADDDGASSDSPRNAAFVPALFSGPARAVPAWRQAGG